MSEAKKFLIAVYTESRIGVVARISLVFTRRYIYIHNMSATPTEIPGVHKITYVINATPDKAQNAVKQIEKLVNVHRAFLHELDECITITLGLYKISKNKIQRKELEDVLVPFNGRIIIEEASYFVIEKTGKSTQIEELLSVLEPYGIIEFTKSGTTSLIKWSKHFHQHLQNLSKEKEEIYVTME